MSARLLPLSHAGVAPLISLQRPVVLVGRHPDCDVRIDLPQMSRRHCCLALAYDRLLLRDLGSRHGVRVNGMRVGEAQLHDGDEIAIGPLIYRLELVPTQQTAAAKKPAQRPTRAESPAPAAAKPASLPNLPLEGQREEPSDLIPLSSLFPGV